MELEPDERLRIFHDFYRAGEETEFRFDIKETRRKGHDFKDFICPDSMEFTGDYFKIGERYGRVLFLREYASYIKDSMVAEMTDLNRNLMMSIDVIPVPTDEAVREAESRLLGVETCLLYTSQLFSYQHSVEEQVKTLTADRTHLRNEIRKVNITDAELSQAKASISLLTEKLKELRKEVKLCQDIAIRSKVIEEKVDAVRTEEEKSKRKENRNYEQRR